MVAHSVREDQWAHLGAAGEGARFDGVGGREEAHQSVQQTGQMSAGVRDASLHSMGQTGQKVIFKLFFILGNFNFLQHK